MHTISYIECLNEICMCHDVIFCTSPDAPAEVALSDQEIEQGIHAGCDLSALPRAAAHCRRPHRHPMLPLQVGTPQTYTCCPDLICLSTASYEGPALALCTWTFVAWPGIHLHCMP